MAFGDITIQVKTLRSGQPRPYADHVRVTQFEFEQEWRFGEMRPLSDTMAKQYLYKLVELDLNGNERARKRNWEDWNKAFDSYLSDIKKIDEGLFQVTERTPFTD